MLNLGNYIKAALLRLTTLGHRTISRDRRPSPPSRSKDGFERFMAEFKTCADISVDANNGPHAKR